MLLTILLSCAKAFVLLEVFLLFLDFLCALLVVGEVYHDKGLFWVPRDKDELKEIVKGKWFMPMMTTLWACTWWWLNGPMVLYQRLIKRNMKATFMEPRRKA